MGTTIDHIELTARHRGHRTSALGLADLAIRQCLEAAGVDASQVDLLVNAGLYRDRNLGEPALAALIQQDVGINPEDRHTGGHGSFSFDIANGTCGALCALQVVDGFMRAGTIRRAVVVTSDADPGHRSAPDFPFAPAGAAALCGWQEGEVGLGPFRWLSCPEDGHLFRSMVHFEHGHNLLRVEIDAEFPVHAAAVASKVVDEVLGEAGLGPSAVGVAVVAPGDPAFVEAFATDSGIPSERIVVAGDPCIHTAGFLAALGEARRGGRLLPGTTALLVAAASGITAGAVLYRS
jgi:3-oxoacyl-[acyl-carrier-protein] synthase-3